MAKRFQNRSFQAVGVMVLIVIGALIILSSYTIVGPGQRGIVVFLGDVEEDNVLPEGFHLVIPPMARQVVPIDVRTRKLEMIVDAASRDMQSMTVTGVLNYHLNPEQVGLLYQQVGLDYENIIVVPALHEDPRPGSDPGWSVGDGTGAAGSPRRCGAGLRQGLS